MKPTVTERKNHPGTYKIVVDQAMFIHLRRLVAADPSNRTDDIYLEMLEVTR